MTINERIRQLRRELGLTQSEFGKTIGLKTSAVSWLEKPGNNVTSQNRQVMCDKYHISMDWLENGTGSMYNEPSDPMEAVKGICQQYSLSMTAEQILRVFAMLTPEERSAALEYIEGLISKDDQMDRENMSMYDGLSVDEQAEAVVELALAETKILEQKKSQSGKQSI